MYIYPNGDVYVLRGIDIDRNYNHTLFSKNFDEQKKKFLATDNSENYIYVKYKLSDQSRGGYYSYQRVNNNSIKVRINANNLYDCNYLIFDNTRYFQDNDNTVVNYNNTPNSRKQKWFFAFIDEVNYINENTTEIKYTIDVMQTYMFDYTIGTTMVSREHTTSDELFEHTVPDIEVNGSTVLNNKVNIVPTIISQGQEVVIPYYYYQLGGIVVSKALPQNIIGDITIPTPHYGTTTMVGDYISSGLYCYTGFVIKSGDFNVLNSNYYVRNKTLGNLINAIVEDENYSSDYIVCAFQYPAYLSTKNFAGETGKTDFVRAVSMAEDFKFGDDSYEPKNKKCFIGQYNRLYITDNNGNVNRYLYELYGTNIPTIRVHGMTYPDITITAYPANYKNTSSCYDERIELNNFVLPSWANNVYKDWWATHKYSETLKGVTLGITNVFTGVRSTDKNTTLNNANSMAQWALRQSDMENIPPNVTFTNSSNFGADNGIQYFTVYQEQLRPEYIKIVDDYFEVYGYKINQLKVPNIISARTNSNVIRKYWNYISTVNCDIHSTLCPASVKTDIENIYNNGITFWNDLSTMGDYSNDNHDLLE